jgi:hypothetical protein
MSSPKTAKRTHNLPSSRKQEPPSSETPEIILMSDVPPPAPVHVHGKTWGPWRFNAHNLTLEHATGYGYYVDLEQCTTSTKVLDRLCQISKKTWCTREGAGYLLQALDKLLNPQATLCSSGQERHLNASAYLKRKLREASNRQD